MSRKKILVFSSGTLESGGSGFENLVNASNDGRLGANIVAVVSNHSNGGVKARATKLGIPFLHFPKPWDAPSYQKIALSSGADFFALSGWLKLVVGLDLRTKFSPKTVFNIHPGPLPDFGGPGLYGPHVHRAIIDAFKLGKISHSAISMHFVTEGYDRGPIFFQHEVRIDNNDTPDSIGEKVKVAELYWQPLITDMVVQGLICWNGIDFGSLKIPENIRSTQGEGKWCK